MRKWQSWCAVAVAQTVANHVVLVWVLHQLVALIALSWVFDEAPRACTVVSTGAWLTCIGTYCNNTDCLAWVWSQRAWFWQFDIWPLRLHRFVCFRLLCNCVWSRIGFSLAYRWHFLNNVPLVWSFCCRRLLHNSAALVRCIKVKYSTLGVTWFLQCLTHDRFLLFRALIHCFVLWLIDCRQIRLLTVVWSSSWLQLFPTWDSFKLCIYSIIICSWCLIKHFTVKVRCALAIRMEVNWSDVGRVLIKCDVAHLLVRAATAHVGLSHC